MYKGLLIHSLLCSEFVELTLKYINPVCSYLYSYTKKERNYETHTIE